MLHLSVFYRWTVGTREAECWGASDIPFPVYSLGSCSMKDHTVEGEHMYGLFFPVGREIYREQESFDLLYISVCGQPHGKAIQRYPRSHSRGGCRGLLPLSSLSAALEKIERDQNLLTASCIQSSEPAHQPCHSLRA